MGIVFDLRKDVTTRHLNSLCFTYSTLCSKAEPIRHFDYIGLELSAKQEGEGDKRDPTEVH
jgi:hypothetical protein